MTTQDGTKLGQNVVQDLTDHTRASRVSPEAAILFDKSIVAKPLMTPEVCSIHIKNTEYRYRWVNRDGQGGRIYTQRRAQGFMNATPSDVDILGGDTSMKDGEIRAGDLILMKIRADLYDSAIKSNMVKAGTLANARGFYVEGGSSDPFSDATPSRKTVSAEPGARSGMAVPFIPPNADAIVNDSIKSGRVEDARVAVEEFRTSAKAEAKK